MTSRGPRPHEQGSEGLSAPGGRHVVAALAGGVLLLAPLVFVVVPLSREAGLRGDPFATALAGAVVCYSAVRLAVFCWHGRPRWAEALFWAFSYVWLGLASLAQVASDTNPLSTSFTAGTQVVALGVVLVGFLAFEVGRRVGGHDRPPAVDEVPLVEMPRRVLSRRRVVVLAVGTVLLTPALVIALGGPEVLFGSRQAVADHLVRGALYTETSHVLGGALLTAANVLPFVAALAALCLLRARVGPRRDLLLAALLGALVVSNLLLNNPISNARNWVLTIGIAFVIAVGFLRRPGAKVAFLALFIAGATVVFPYADAFRTEQTGVHNSLRSSSMPVDYFIGKTDYGASTDVGVTVLHVEREGHTWGRQLLGAAAFWVPRAAWDDKPVNTAEILADEIRFPNRNLDTPLWAEGYIDFGVLGTVALLGAFGALVRRVDDVLERAEFDPRRCADVAFPIAVSFVGYESFLLRGSLLQAMARIVTLVAVFLLLSTRSAAPGAPTTGPGTPARAGGRSTA